MTTLSRLCKPFLALSLLALAPLSGCASQAEIDRLNDANRALMSQNTQLTTDLDAARTENIRLGAGIGGKEGAFAQLRQQLADALSQRDRALADLKAFGDKFGQIQFAAVDADTDRALTALADQYPDLITYDRASGMLRVNSDLTFDSGRADVKPAAKPALQALANILNSGAAQQYDVYIEGHTDSQRISANTAREHKTNRHLSAHRAIAVLDELRGLGVAPQKMMAAGWGEFRPAVPNTPSGNTPANRRVEIYLVKSRGTFAPTTEAPAPTTNDNEIIK